MAGKQILLIGSSGGIGSQLANMFPYDNVIHHFYRHKPAFDGECVSADITNYQAVESMIENVLYKFNRIDVLINASGVSVDGFAHKFAFEAWKEVIEVNLNGSFNLVRAVLPSMRKNQYGRIVLLSSVVFQRPVMGTSAYSASKSALVGLTRTVALENASMGITCNCVSLGYFEAGILYKIAPDFREELRQAIPQKRFGHVSELHRTIEYLMDTDYLTGQVINLNGGLHML